MSQNSKPLNYQKLLVVVIILSLLLGAVGGAASTWLIAGQAVNGKYAKWLNQSLFKTKGTVVEKQETVKVEEESTTIDAVTKVQPSVVSIIVSKDLSQYYQNRQFFSPFDPFGDFFNLPGDTAEPNQGTNESQPNMQEVGGGTGFVVSEDGLILTNKHVVSDTEAEYTVITNDDKEYSAKVLATDPTNDLAIIKIEPKDKLTPAELGDSDSLKIGQTVIAIGNTLAEFRNTSTKGIVSGLSRKFTAGDGTGQSETIEGAIQTDAAINPGNSGGPLINLLGQVIGINTAIANPSGSQTNIGIGFAIPVNTAKSVVDSVKKTGKIVRPYLGIRYILLNKEIAQANNLTVESGALIIRGTATSDLAVVPGSPADKAGLVENDIIIEADGQKIDPDHSLALVISKHQSGEEISLKVWHEGAEKTVTVTLGEYPQ